MGETKTHLELLRGTDEMRIGEACRNIGVATAAIASMIAITATISTSEKPCCSIAVSP